MTETPPVEHANEFNDTSLGPLEGTNNNRQLSIKEEIERSRLNEIMQERQIVQEIRLNMTLNEREFDRIDYHEALKNLLLTVRPFANTDENTQKFWKGTPDHQIGQIVITPPPKESQLWKDDDTFLSSQDSPRGDYVPYNELRPKVVAQLNGLIDVLRAGRHTADFAYYSTGLGNTRHYSFARVTQPIAPHLLDRAVEWTYEYLNYLGLDIDVTEIEQDSTNTTPL